MDRRRSRTVNLRGHRTLDRNRGLHRERQLEWFFVRFCPFLLRLSASSFLRNT
ncbi:hypothetical protein GS933_17575 [Rhodococcus hoagii]|nr:hypothetical protein [Prescottella equi]